MRNKEFDNILIENNLHITKEVAPEEFSSLRIRSGMRERAVEQAKIALKNTLFMIGVRDCQNQLIGFARVVGDGATSLLISDVMVDLKLQKRGIGKCIFTHVDDYLDSVATKSTYICLVADTPADKLYSKFGFVHLDPEKAVGMYRYKGYMTD